MSDNKLNHDKLKRLVIQDQKNRISAAEKALATAISEIEQMHSVKVDVQMMLSGTMQPIARIIFIPVDRAEKPNG